MEITYSKFKSAVIESGKRIITVLQFGAKTAKEISPFGIDSQPPPGMTALFLETSNKGESVIVGYVNNQQLAEAGGTRMYSLGESGEVSGFVYARASGVLELNGSDYSAVRFQELKTQIDLLQQQINSQWPLIASGIVTGAGAYTPTNVDIDLSNAESSTVKLK